MFRKFECRYDIHSGFDSQPEGLGVAFFATGPSLGLIMYILTTLEFPKRNHDFHPLTTTVNAKILLLTYLATCYVTSVSDSASLYFWYATSR